MKLSKINHSVITEANWHNRKKYENVHDLLVDFYHDHENEHEYWFVSFTKVDKLGINPSSKYSTPIGIYSYQLKYAVDEGAIEELPFAESEPFVNLFKISSDALVLDMDMPESEFDYHIRAISSKFGKSPSEELGEYELRSNGSGLWLFARELAGKDPAKWNKIFRSVGIDGFVDNGTGTIHTSETTQAVFFSTAVIQKTIRLLNRDVKFDKTAGGLRQRRSNVEILEKRFDYTSERSIRIGDPELFAETIKNGINKRIVRILEMINIVMPQIIKYERLEFLKILMELFDRAGSYIGDDLIKWIVKNDQLEAFRYLHEVVGVKISRSHVYLAIYHDRSDIMRYILSENVAKSDDKNWRGMLADLAEQNSDKIGDTMGMLRNYLQRD
jgi:hypothetical protein